MRHLCSALTPIEPDIPVLQAHTNTLPKASHPFPSRDFTARGPHSVCSRLPFRPVTKVGSVRDQQQKTS